MLVLKRNIDQRVFVDTPSGRITITIVELGDTEFGNRMVKLGFEAPQEFQICREDAKRREPRRRI